MFNITLTLPLLTTLEAENRGTLNFNTISSDHSSMENTFLQFVKQIIYKVLILQYSHWSLV